MTDRPAEQLPTDAVLLHIGPYKTGTTALQSALFAAKPALKQYGASYPGRWRRLVGGGYAVMRWSPPGQPLPELSVWEEFAAQVRAEADRRVCVSTEDFGTLRDRSTITTIVDDLGGDRVHVAVVARALHTVLPSHWQERIKTREVRTFPEWLRTVLTDPDAAPGRTPSGHRTHRAFWASHDVAAAASAWLPIVGRDRFHVIIANDSDRGYLLRVFEQLLGLPAGLLSPESIGNESLSLSRLDALRRLNRRLEDLGLTDDLYRALIKFGLVKGLRAATPSDGDRPLPAMPGWATDRVRTLSRQRAEAVRDLDLQVIGDLDRLLLPTDYSPDDDQHRAPDTVPVEMMVESVTELMAAVARREKKLKRDAPAGSPTADRPGILDQQTTTALLAELLTRGRRAASRLPFLSSHRSAAADDGPEHGL